MVSLFLTKVFVHYLVSLGWQSDTPNSSPLNLASFLENPLFKPKVCARHGQKAREPHSWFIYYNVSLFLLRLFVSLLTYP